MTILDSLWFADMGAQGSVGFHTLKTDEVDLDALQWQATRQAAFNDGNPYVCTPSTTFADWKANIEKLCATSNICTYQATQAIKAFVDHAVSVSQRVK